MNIIKKDGRIQEFDISKIKTSIRNASRDVEGLNLNTSDLNIMSEDIKEKIKRIRKDGSDTSSYEVIGIVCDVLNKDGFGVLQKVYMEF